MYRSFLERFAAGIISLALLLTAPGPVAAKTAFPMYGGTGDAGFQDRCPANQYVTGLAGRAGNVIDNIRIICSPLLPNGTHGPSYYGPPRGGSGGGEQEFSCSTDAFVSGVRYALVQPNNRMWNVDLVCRSTQQNGTSIVSFRAANYTYENNVLATSQFCPNDEYATGFAGRYGRHVNALGLYCDVRVTSDASVPAPVRSAFPIRLTGKAASVPGSADSVSARCPSGFVWREASPADHVCVTPVQRGQTKRENVEAAAHAVQSDGTAGPPPCAPGYVWREAYSGDVVCVTPQERRTAAQENASAP